MNVVGAQAGDSWVGWSVAGTRRSSSARHGEWRPVGELPRIVQIDDLAPAVVGRWRGRWLSGEDGLAQAVRFVDYAVFVAVRLAVVGVDLQPLHDPALSFPDDINRPVRTLEGSDKTVKIPIVSYCGS